MHPCQYHLLPVSAEVQYCQLEEQVSYRANHWGCTN